jgi:hypothetical protein
MIKLPCRYRELYLCAKQLHLFHMIQIEIGMVTPELSYLGNEHHKPSGAAVLINIV